VGLISDDDRAQMQADILMVMGDRQEDIVIRRGDEPLEAQ